MIDYHFCNQTITVYRLEGSRVLRLVVPGCYYFWQVQQVTDVYGTRQETKCLLIMPGESQQVFLGDRIYEGVGPEVTAREWPAFLPVTVPGLAEITYVRPVWWDGKISHIEAGNQ